MLNFTVHYEVPENPPRWAEWKSSTLDSAHEMKDILHSQGMKAFVTVEVPKVKSS